MRLLIVDDEYYSAKGIEQRVLDENLGFSNVVCAFSAAQGREEMERQPADVLLTDIQMPKGSGLELAAWCREHYPDTICVFLTAFASFDYASAALKLESLDYLLKPVTDEQLSGTLAKAISRARLIRERKEQAAFADLAKNRIAGQFWLGLGRGDIPTGNEAVIRLADTGWLAAEQKEESVCLVIARFWQRDGKVLAVQGLVEGTRARMLLATGDSTLTLALEPANEQVLMMVFPAAYRDRCPNGLLTQLLQYYEQELEITAYLAVRPALSIMEFRDGFQSLLFDMHNLDYPRRGIRLVRHEKTPHEHSTLLPAQRWVNLIVQGQFDALLREATDILDAFCNSKHFSRDDLVRFYHNFLQVLYSALERFNSSPSRLMDKPLYQECHDKACDSIKGMGTWLKQALEDFNSTISLQALASDEVSTVCCYIEQHLDEKLEREQLAALVHISPDHLSHIFKEQKGLTLSGYILQLRIQRAKELLLTTRQSVQQIALACGFQQESYFIRQFKRKTGRTPAAFRRTF